MKNRSSWTAVVIVLGCLPAIPAVTQAAPDAKHVFQSLYNQLDKANVDKDTDAVVSMYSPEYVGVRENGEKYGFDHMRDGAVKLFAKYKTVRSKTVVQSATIAKEGATVVTHTRGAYVRDSNVPGQEVTIAYSAADRDFWVKSPSGWKIKQERHLSFQQTRTASPNP